MLKPKIYVESKNKIFDVDYISIINKTCGVTEYDGSCKEYTFDEVEFMSGTGVKDKNGKHMCENDIVEYRNPFFKEAIRGVVNSNKEIVSNNVIINLEEYEGNGLEVVGNIYENKELLKNE